MQGQPDDPGVGRADFDYDDMTRGDARAILFIVGAATLIFIGLIIGGLTWWFR